MAILSLDLTQYLIFFQANGFLGAKGPAGGIPWAYSLIAHKFHKQVVNNKQQFRINLLEYLRIGWTYHAKGLW